MQFCRCGGHQWLSGHLPPPRRTAQGGRKADLPSEKEETNSQQVLWPYLDIQSCEQIIKLVSVEQTGVPRKNILFQLILHFKEEGAEAQTKQLYSW